MQHPSKLNLQDSGSDQESACFTPTTANGEIITNNTDGSIARAENNMEDFQNTWIFRELPQKREISTYIPRDIK